MQEDRQQGRKQCSGNRTGHSACTLEAETTDPEMDMYTIRAVSQQL